MPEKETVERAQQDEREGKSPTTQAGEFVREEMHHIREGKHGARSTKQAIAIGLSKARRSGVKLGAPKKGRTSAQTRQKAQRDLRKGKSAGKKKISATRSRATSKALKREGRQAASKKNCASGPECGQGSRTRRSSSSSAEDGRNKREDRLEKSGAESGADPRQPSPRGIDLLWRDSTDSTKEFSIWRVISGLRLTK